MEEEEEARRCGTVVVVLLLQRQSSVGTTSTTTTTNTQHTCGCVQELRLPGMRDLSTAELPLFWTRRGGFGGYVSVSGFHDLSSYTSMKSMVFRVSDQKKFL